MGHDALVAGLTAFATIMVYVLISVVRGKYRVAKEKTAEKEQEVSRVEKALGPPSDVSRSGSTVTVGCVAVDSYSHVAYERPEVFAEHYYQRHRDRDDYYQPGIDGPRITKYFQPALEEASKAFYEYNWTEQPEPRSESESGSLDQEVNILTSPHTVGHCKEYPEDCPKYRG